jgi:hypothetical protein
MSMPLGHRTYLGPKGKGENSMFGKRMCSEAVYGHDPQDPSDMVKAELPELQRPFSKNSGGRVARLHTPLGLRIPGGGSAPGNDIVASQGRSERPQGLKRSTYVTLPHPSRSENGIAYGTRVLWRRSLRSSRGSHAPPRRTGKPFAWRREAGACRFSADGRSA